MTTATELSENSHQGFDGIKAGLCLGSMEAKSNTASGMQLRLWRNRKGSRSSGKERDQETGLDHFEFRDYSPMQGRFTRPDPENFGADIRNPQSWNGYSYVFNSPLRYIDRFGLYPDCYVNGISADCSIAYGMVRSGAGAIVPTGWPLTYYDYDDRNYKMLMAGAGGALGYVNFSDLSQLHEWAGKFYNTDTFETEILEPRREMQRRYLATYYALNSRWEFDEVYNNLRFSDTVGGNANFLWIGNLDPSTDLANMSKSRTPGMPSIHMKPRGTQVRLHIDTANPYWRFPLGALAHFVVDVVFGNMNGEVPLVR